MIELILEGELAARMAQPQRTLAGIQVRQADLESLLPDIRERYNQVRGHPVHRLAKILFPGRPIKPTVLNKWIAAGLIKAQRIGRARIVRSEEVQRFRSEYCLANEACRLLGISRSTLSRWELEGRVQPVYGKRVTSGAGFSLYAEWIWNILDVEGGRLAENHADVDACEKWGNRLPSWLCHI